MKKYGTRVLCVVLAMVMALSLCISMAVAAPVTLTENNESAQVVTLTQTADNQNNEDGEQATEETADAEDDLQVQYKKSMKKYLISFGCVAVLCVVVIVLSKKAGKPKHKKK